MENQTATQVKGKYPSIPPATDHGVGLRLITGRTVTLRGKKVDGTPFVRTLANCTYVPGRGLAYHTVVGLDIAINRVRSFRLCTVETLTLRASGVELRGADLCATIEHHLRLGQGPVEKLVVNEEAA